ncbi:unnamed protein product [Candidula unifasciata]|uniref:tRNA pseudouridine(55) synthase n=1 Tax=Candidula unifasciata TaxID=100452 RepID=A0A8S3YUG6_9EUPU|nr:unnamed protein product [Candidula unifasciata]
MDTFEIFTSSAEETKQIVSDLQQTGCCTRCILRLLGELRSLTYRSSLEEIERALLPEDQQSSVTTNQCPCPGCLGILQKFAEQPFLNTIVKKVREDGYQFSAHQCSLILPVSLAIRQKALLLYLQKKYPDVYKGKEGSIASVKDVWKWSCGHRMASLLNAKFQNRSEFDILMTFSYKDSDRECAFLLDVFPETFKKRKQRKFGFETFTRSNVMASLQQMDGSKFEDCSSCPPPIPTEDCSVDISCSHNAVFIAGRYQKYSRELSQTPWVVDGKRIMEGSVQELICEHIVNTFKPTEHRFSSSGREDVDVRMLGIGRPFVVELINPHCVTFSRQDIADLQERINTVSKYVQVRDLQIVSREEIAKLKEGEIDKTKTYSALCWCDRELTLADIEMLAAIKDLRLQQKTPLRVLHRRTAATRERTIHSLKATKEANNRFKILMSTQAGTYIKEFVHGDFGRTYPNMSDLLKAECDIIDLDVESVDVDWPVFIDPLPQASETVDSERSCNSAEDCQIKDAGVMF